MFKLRTAFYIETRSDLDIKCPSNLLSEKQSMRMCT